MLVEYVEEVLELYHEAQWNDAAFKYFLWSGMDNILRQKLLLKEGPCTPYGHLDPPSTR